MTTHMVKTENGQEDNVSSSEDNMSDLDMDLESLARRPTGTAELNTGMDGSRSTGFSSNDSPVVEASNSRLHRSEEVSLLSDEEQAQPGTSGVTAVTTGSGANADRHYKLRERKRRVDFSAYKEDSDDDETDSRSAKSRKLSNKQKESVPLDVLSLMSDQLQRFIGAPRLVKTKSLWRFNPSVLYDIKVNPRLVKFFKKCGPFLEHLQLVSSNGGVDVQNDILNSLIKHSSNLRKITLTYMSSQNVEEFVSNVNLWKGKLKHLCELRLTSIAGDGTLKKSAVAGLVKCGIEWTELELGDFLWEDSGPECLEQLLETCKNSLKSLTIHGGFKGTKKGRFIVRFPRMKELQTLSICPKYSFISEIQNPLSKKARLIRLDLTEEKEEPFKFALQFSSDLPQLKNVTLGNLVELEELPFSYLKKLNMFKCGSYWNLSIRFPLDGSRSALQGSTITALQFPDALKDPSFIPKLAKFFPNVKKVWINLPSVPVLRSFFKNFGSCKVEELTLKTQFDFESLMESCLLPEDPDFSDTLRRSSLTQTQVDTLKEYKWFSEYIRYHNVELPLVAGDLMEGNSAGIRSLKSLKRLHLEHVPRILLIPNPEDERKWYDHNCKFLSQTFGFTLYPFSRKCHLQILRMDLDQYTWKNLKHTERGGIEMFSQVGYSTMQEAEVDQLSDEEDLFVPVGRAGGVNVAIKPSMLHPEYFKSKAERE